MTQGLWDEEDGFFYDVLRMPDDCEVPVRARSMVGLLPLFAATLKLRQSTLWERARRTSRRACRVVPRPTSRSFAGFVREASQRTGRPASC